MKWIREFLAEFWPLILMGIFIGVICASDGSGCQCSINIDSKPSRGEKGEG